MSLLQSIATGVQGAGAAASGIMSLINAFKGPQGPVGMEHLGNLDLGLAPYGGAGGQPTTAIPSINMSAAGDVPNYKLSLPKDNALLMKLLGAYSA